MKPDCFVSGILFLFWFVTEVSVALDIESLRKADAFEVVQQLDSERSEDVTEEGTTTDPPDTFEHRKNDVSNTETTVQLLPTPTPRYSPDDVTLLTQLYLENNTAPDVDPITKAITGAVRNTDLTTDPIMTLQNNANLIHETTEGVTTEDFTDTTPDIRMTTRPPYCPIDLEPKLFQVNSTAITLTWLPLKDESESYLVNVHPVGPAYDVPSHCTPDEGKNKQIYTDMNNLTYEPTLPKYTYNFSITTITSCRTQAAGSLSVTTLPMAPEAPEMLEHVVHDNGTTTFYWRLPCNLNGIPDHFNLRFYGRYSLNDSLEDSKINNISAARNISLFSCTQNLRLAFKYWANVSLVIEDEMEGQASEVFFTTPDDVPGKPIFIEIDTTDRLINVSWNAPTEPTGAIDGYELTVLPRGPLYPKWINCDYDYEPKVVRTKNSTRHGSIEADPYYEYQLLLRAHSSSGYGEYANETANTKESDPDNVQDVNVTVIPPTQVEYNGKAQIRFKSCRPNGNLAVHNITIHSWRDQDGFNETQTDTIDHDQYKASLRPNYQYRFMITIDNGFSSNETSWYSFSSGSGVPAVSSNSMIVLREGSTEAEVTLIKAYLNESNGGILYIALILSDKNVTSGYFSQWDGKQWPAVHNPEAGMYYQITDDWWNPFEEKHEVKFTIGSGGLRNKPLDPEKEYYLIVRLFTSDFYRNSEVVYFKTVPGYGLSVRMLIGVVVGVLMMLAIFPVLYFIMRRRINSSEGRPYTRIFSRRARNQVMKSFSGILERPFGTFSLTSDERLTRNRPSDAHSELKKTDMLSEFVKYCKSLEEDPDKFTSQFDDITRRGKEIVSEKLSSFAKLPENWRKNRYVNILAYDDTRVKLLIDEDDEMGSDYINASYIEGYTRKAEYIATQGPLPTTCRDFWKMVLQENVKVIVMVSQFIVNKKEKCFRYFPEKGKIMIIGDDLEIRCMTELHFGTYCVRTIQVQKDNLQTTIIHMQYLEWPDFGVPLGTEHMLQFCYQVRNRVNQEGGCVVVHCSAGVGRTGTFIATDILLQKACDRKALDVFETVMKLREQRTLMVQTEEQYKYIYMLLRDHLERPPSPDMAENSEHIYENISVIQNNQDLSDTIIVESAF